MIEPRTGRYDFIMIQITLKLLAYFENPEKMFRYVCVVQVYEFFYKFQEIGALMVLTSGRQDLYISGRSGSKWVKVGFPLRDEVSR